MKRARKALSRIRVSRSSGARTKQSLGKLEDLDSEVLDYAEINNNVRSLVPIFQNELEGAYCQVCQEFPTTWSQVVEQGNSVTEPVLFPHTASIQHLEAAGIAGCRLCRLLWQQISPSDVLYAHKVEKRLRALGQPTTLLIVAKYTELSKLRYMVTQTSISLLNRHGCLLVSKFNEPTPFSSTITISDQPIANAINLAKQWIHGCTQDHSLCNTSIQPLVPTRLLFIASSNATESQNECRQQTVRLVETADWAPGVEPVQYATLSHCWGGLEFLNLTTRTLESFKIGIPFDSLTQTFRDAINATLDLGLRYIWIDSLCIIQDSDQDWGIEAGRMSSVYGGSFINIAASGAKDGTKGLFLKPPNLVGAAHFPPSSPSTTSYGISLTNLYSGGITDTLLSSRAWCFQERLLSPRTLYFGQGDLFWECRTHDACESLPNVFPEALKKSSVIRPRKSTYEIWPEIVRMYSRCNVTFSKDKLVALAGVARVAESESGDHYLAGLWRAKMEKRLCWWAGSSTVRPKDGLYRAPTWSWASVDGSVWYPDDRLSEPEKLSHVLDVCLSSLGPDAFSQVSGGMLTLGYSSMLTATFFIGEYIEVKIHGKGQDIEVDCGSDEYCEGIEYDENDRNLDVIAIPMLKWNPPPETPIDDSGVEGENLVERNQDHASILGLLLRPTKRKQGEFKRVGSFSIHDWDQGWGLFCEVLEEMGPRIAREYCAETRLDSEAGTEQYIITII